MTITANLYKFGIKHVVSWYNYWYNSRGITYYYRLLIDQSVMSWLFSTTKTQENVSLCTGSHTNDTIYIYINKHYILVVVHEPNIKQSRYIFTPYCFYVHIQRNRLAIQRYCEIN